MNNMVFPDFLNNSLFLSHSSYQLTYPFYLILFKTTSTISSVETVSPPSISRSIVWQPDFNAASTLFSIASDSSDRWNVYFNIIAADRIIASGFTLFSPAMSGAETWTGSYQPKPVLFRLADGRSPIDPVLTDASSLNISPKRFSVTTTSKWFGSVISFIAVESTSACSTSTSG